MSQFDFNMNRRQQLVKKGKAVDKIPEDLDELLKKFVVSILKKAAAKSGNKVDDLLVAQLEKALFE